MFNGDHDAFFAFRFRFQNIFCISYKTLKYIGLSKKKKKNAQVINCRRFCSYKSGILCCLYNIIRKIISMVRLRTYE